MLDNGRKEIPKYVVYIRLASNKRVKRKRVNAITRKVPRRKIPRGTKVVGVY